MATQEVVNRYWQNVILNSADDIAISPNGTGFDLTQAWWATTDTIRFNEIDSWTPNPKLQFVINGNIVQTIDINKNDIQINGTASDFDLSDDTLEFVESNGDTSGVISFAKYNISAATVGTTVQISQNGSVIATINQWADGISYDSSGNSLTSTDVQGAIDEVNTKIDNSSGGIEFQDDIVATAAQTVFALTNTPITGSQVNISRNGVILAKASVSVSGTTATYNPTQNWGNPMEAGDRVSLTYEY